MGWAKGEVGILNSVDRCLPMKEILQTYLNNDINDEESETNNINIREMIKRDIHDEGGIKKVLDSDSIHDDFDLLDNDVHDISSLIFGKNTHDTVDFLESHKQPENNNQKSEKQIIENVADDQQHNEQKSETKKSEKHSEKHSEKSDVDINISKLLTNKRKGKISENILQEAIDANSKKMDNIINIEKTYNNADNYFEEMA